MTVGSCQKRGFAETRAGGAFFFRFFLQRGDFCGRLTNVSITHFFASPKKLFSVLTKRPSLCNKGAGFLINSLQSQTPNFWRGTKKRPCGETGPLGKNGTVTLDLFKEVVSARNRSYIYTVMR